jgi:Rrf2 family protein
MQITRAADYAVRVMVYLAAFPQGTRIRRSTLVEVSAVPEEFLSKILQRLVSARLMSSHRGSGGGFELAALPENISLLNVVEAVDGPVQVNVCVAGGPGCERQAFCAVHPVWDKAQKALLEILNGESIASLASKSNGSRNPALASGYAS